CPFLAADIGEVGRRSLVAVERGRCGLWGLALPPEVFDGLDEVAYRDRPDTGERDLCATLRCADNTTQTVAPSTLRRREHAGHGTEAAVERELSDGCMPPELPRRQLVGRAKHGKRNRQGEARPFLAKVRGRKVDGEPPLPRPLQLGGEDSAADAVLRLGAGAIGKPDDRETGNAVLQVRLYLDAAGLETDERVRDGACEHVV